MKPGKHLLLPVFIAGRQHSVGGRLQRCGKCAVLRA